MIVLPRNDSLTSMTLTPIVAGLVLLAALMHASWNALVKSHGDRQAGFAIVLVAGIPFGLVLLPFASNMGATARPRTAKRCRLGR